MRAVTTAIALTLAAGVAAPASAGILINPKGIFLTEPEVPSFVTTEEGQAFFGGPGVGFRRPGRTGFFPQPFDPGLPRNGRNAFGPDGFKFEQQPHGKIEKKLSDTNIFFWLD
ncbi:MAG: hypothetical protein AAGE80_05725 [Pseudomonadota bacterium]